MDVDQGKLLLFTDNLFPFIKQEIVKINIIIMY